MLTQEHFHNLMDLEMEAPLIPLPLQLHKYSNSSRQHGL